LRRFENNLPAVQARAQALADFLNSPEATQTDGLNTPQRVAAFLENRAHQDELVEFHVLVSHRVGKAGTAEVPDAGVGNAFHTEAGRPGTGRQVLLVGPPNTEQGRKPAEFFVARPEHHVAGAENHGDLHGAGSREPPAMPQ
jgi:hypothetical protein